MDIDDDKLLASEDGSESWQDQKSKFYFFCFFTYSLF